MGLLSSAISAGANLLGAKLASDAQEKEADRIRDASREGVQVSQAARDRGIGAIRAGVDEQEVQLGAIARGAIPGMLSPEQKIAMDDIIRGGQTSIAASPGLRGSGRAQSRIIQDTIGRTRAGFQAENQAKLDRAREAIGQVRAGEGRDVANIETGFGAQASEAIRQGTQAAAPYSSRAAVNLGQGVIDTARTASAALGAQLAQDEKAAASRRYARTDI